MVWLLERLKEPSTWAGVAIAAQALSQLLVNVSPEMVGSAVAAIVAVLMREGAKK